jgi:hypothetical protein
MFQSYRTIERFVVIHVIVFIYNQEHLKFFLKIVISDNAIYLHEKCNDLCITIEPDNDPTGLKHVLWDKT